VSADSKVVVAKGIELVFSGKKVMMRRTENQSKLPELKGS
jgi:hypothetical protein